MMVPKKFLVVGATGPVELATENCFGDNEDDPARAERRILIVLLKLYKGVGRRMVRKGTCDYQRSADS